jgi:hypothetical protein
MRHGGMISAFLTCTWLLCAGMARGQPADPQERFNQAVEMATGGDYDKAVEACLDVLGQLPESERPRVHKLLGYSYMKLEMLPESWHHLTIYLESSATEDTTAGGWLQEVEAALKQTHVRVGFSCRPEGLTLTVPASKPGAAGHSPFRIPPVVSGVEGRSAFVWWFRPGKHTVNADAPDHEPSTVEIDVRERGDSGMREIRLAAVTPISTEPAPTHTELAKDGLLVTDHSAIRNRNSAIARWALIGSGIGLGVVGGVLHGVGYSRNEDLHDRYLNRASYPDPDKARSLYDSEFGEQVRPLQISAYVLYGVGGAALAAGVLTWLVGDPLAGDKKVDVSALPTVGPHHAGAVFQWTF